MTPPRVSTVVVDAANVVGSRPDGWWRDRAGAAGRLLTRLAAAATAAPELAGRDVVVVLEGRANDAVVPEHAPLEVVRAPHDGDATIAGLAAARAAGGVLVVTSDRGLRERVEAVGAQVHGAGWLLGVLDRADG